MSVPSTGAGSILAPAASAWPLAPVARAQPPFATQPEVSASEAGGDRRARPNFQFDISDIERAHSISYVSRLHAEPRCPLEPVYRLPRVAERPITPPRFVRDSMAVDDIDRARATPLYSGTPARPLSSLEVSDLGPSARPLSRYPERRLGSSSASSASNSAYHPSASLNSRDITHTKFVSRRSTNPLDPQYAFGSSSALDVSSIVGAVQRAMGSNAKGKAAGASGDEHKESDSMVLHGPVEGSKPRQPLPARQPHNASLSLRTEDISSPEALNWSWSKPVRSSPSRSATLTADIPGASPGADRARMLKTTRVTNPNERNYPPSRDVSDQAGMVHVHRHVLDGSPHAASWRPPQGQPDPDAAGVSMWRNENFTAGMLPPRKAQQQQQQTKSVFGAPAEDTFNRDSAIGNDATVATEAAKPAPAVVRVQTPQLQREEEAAPVVTSATAPAATAPAAPVTPSSVPLSHLLVSSPSAPSALSAAEELPPNLSYPPDVRRAPPQQKRHKPLQSQATNNSFIAHPQSNGREWAPAPLSGERVPVMTFGLRGPFAVPTGRASIEETQGASTVSATSTAAASRANSRPQSRITRPTSAASTQHSYHQAAAAVGQYDSPLRAMDRRSTLLSTLSPTATILSNAFSSSYVPMSGATGLPRTLPYSSPVARPGLGTTQFYERTQGGNAPPPSNRAGVEALARTQARKMATLRAEEIQQVRALC